MTVRQAAIELLTQAGRSPEHIAKVLHRVQRMVNDGASLLDRPCTIADKEKLRRAMAAMRLFDEIAPGSAEQIARTLAARTNSKS